MNLDESIATYIKAAKYELGLAPTTLIKFQSYLRRFARWLTDELGREPTLDDFTTENLRRFVYHLSEPPISQRPRTVGAYLSAPRSFGEWLVGQKLKTQNPAASIRKPKLDEPERVYVTNEEVQKLLIGCDRLKDPIRCALAKAVLCVCCYCGLRRSEILALKLSSVSIHDGVLHVQKAKGRKVRDIPLQPDCRLVLAHWMAVRPSCRHDYLFCHTEGGYARRLGDVGLTSLLNEIKAAADLRDHANIQIHALRRNCAVYWLEHEADIEDVRELLGHTSIAVTQAYIGKATERRKNLANALPSRLAPPEREEAEPSRKKSQEPAPMDPPAPQDKNTSFRHRLIWRAK